MKRGEHEFAILDHGYVDLVTSWGSDEAIIEAARMSTGKGFLGWEDRCSKCGVTADVSGYCRTPLEHHDVVKGDAHLLKYLYTHKHMTPFEMCGLVIEVQAPIFVFREWHRHRTQSYNEMSARYIPLPDVNYVPDLENLLQRAIAAQESGNKQARAATAKGDPVEANDLARWLVDLENAYMHCQRVYRHGLDLGVPKELARLTVPVGRYSRMRASANLRNWLGFLTLRLPEGVQEETRRYAGAVDELVRQHFPRTHALFAGGAHEA